MRRHVLQNCEMGIAPKLPSEWPSSSVVAPKRRSLPAASRGAETTNPLAARAVPKRAAARLEEGHPWRMSITQRLKFILGQIQFVARWSLYEN